MLQEVTNLLGGDAAAAAQLCGSATIDVQATGAANAVIQWSYSLLKGEREEMAGMKTATNTMFVLMSAYK